MRIKKLIVNWPGDFNAGDEVFYKNLSPAVVLSHFSLEVPFGLIPVMICGEERIFKNVLPGDLERFH